MEADLDGLGERLQRVGALAARRVRVDGQLLSRGQGVVEQLKQLCQCRAARRMRENCSRKAASPRIRLLCLRANSASASLKASRNLVTCAASVASSRACCGAVPLEVRVSTNGGADWAAGRPPGRRDARRAGGLVGDPLAEPAA